MNENLIINLEILPMNSPKLLKYCSKCGDKTHFINSNMFRMNANGNTQDIWLIYHCEKCNTTFNLNIAERIKTKDIPHNYFKQFENNDINLAQLISFNTKIIKKNNIIIDWSSIKYTINGTIKYGDMNTTIIHIFNNANIKYRLDKILSSISKHSRTSITTLIKNGDIYNENINLSKVISTKDTTIYCKNHSLIREIIDYYL